MNANTPLTTGIQPTFYEGSSLASLRDKRSSGNLWKPVSRVTKQGNSTALALGKIQREVSGMRRRIVGGSNQTPSTGFNFNQTIDPGAVSEEFLGPGDGSYNYNTNDVVTISAGNNATTSWFLDPDSGVYVQSRTGVFVCLQSTDNSRIPQWPAPYPQEPDYPTNYWWPLSITNPYRGNYGFTAVYPGPPPQHLGISGAGTWGVRFADGDIVQFVFQCNYPISPSGFLAVPFMHVGNTLNETAAPIATDIAYATTFGGYSLSQSSWVASGFAFSGLANTILDVTKLVPAWPSVGP